MKSSDLKRMHILNFRQPIVFIIFITIVAIMLFSIGVLFNPFSGDQGVKGISVQEAAQAVDQIGAEIENEKVVNDGIEYNIRISNNSNYLVYDLNLALSYPLKIGNGSISNNDRIGAELKVESIESGSYEIVKVFVPSAYFLKDNMDGESLEVNLDGYLNEVKEQNKFSLSGAIDSRDDSN